MNSTRLLIRPAVAAILLAVLLSVISHGGTAKAASAVSLKNADQIITTGKKYLGVKYRFGAPSNVTYAFDCSSFVQYIFRKNGVTLPRTSAEQSKRGVAVSKGNLLKGDLVFFKDPGRSGSVGHVAVYAGNNTILHTYGKGGVRFSSLSSAYWTKHYVKARRVLTTAPVQTAVQPEAQQPSVLPIAEPVDAPADGGASAAASSTEQTLPAHANETDGTAPAAETSADSPALPESGYPAAVAASAVNYASGTADNR